MPPARNAQIASQAPTITVSVAASGAASAMSLRFRSGAAKPTIEGTKVVPRPPAWERKSFHQS